MPPKSRPHTRPATYTCYVKDIFKKKAPKDRIGADTVRSITGMISDVESRIIAAANDLRQHGVSRGTLQANDIQSAIQMTLTGDLCKHAVSEGTQITLKPSLLSFPAARAGHHLRASARMHVSPEAAIYLTAVLGYLITEIIGMALQEKDKHDGIVTITPAHLNCAIQKDKEFSQCFRSGVIAHGGVAFQMMKDSNPKSKKKSR